MGPTVLKIHVITTGVENEFVIFKYTMFWFADVIVRDRLIAKLKEPRPLNMDNDEPDSDEKRLMNGVEQEVQDNQCLNGEDTSPLIEIDQVVPDLLPGNALLSNSKGGTSSKHFSETPHEL